MKTRKPLVEFCFYNVSITNDKNNIKSKDTLDRKFLV